MAFGSRKKANNKKHSGSEVSSELRLHSLLAAISQGIQENDLAGTITFSNPAHHNMLGYSLGELIGKSIWDLVYDEDKAIELKEYLSFLISSQPEPTPYTCLSRKKDGSSIATQVDWSYQRNERGELTGFVSIISDITERQRAEMVLSDSKRYFQSLDLVWQALSKSTVIDDMLHHVAEEILNIFDCDRAWFLYPCDPDSTSWRVPVEVNASGYPGAFKNNSEIATDALAQKVFNRALESNKAISFDFTHEHLVSDPLKKFEIKTQIVIVIRPRTGQPWLLGMHQCRNTRQWTDNEKKLLQDIALRITDSLTNHVLNQKLRDDLNKRQILEKTVRAEKDLAQHYLDVAQFMMIALDVTGRITLINRKACEVLGYKQEQLLGQDWFSTCLPERDHRLVRRVFDQLMSGDLESTEYFENYIFTATGNERLIAWHNAMQTDLEGNTSGTLSCGEDITEYRLAEEKLKTSEANLAQAQRIAKVGNWNMDLVDNRLTWSDEVYRIFNLRKV